MPNEELPPKAHRLNDDDDIPRSRRRREDDDYEAEEDDEDDYEEEQPRRRGKGDATGGVIPYKNGQALAAYYCGVFSLIPGIGLILGLIALILGILGIRKASQQPEVKGTAHAIVGIVLGGLTFLGNLTLLVLIIIGIASR